MILRPWLAVKNNAKKVNYGIAFCNTIVHYLYMGTTIGLERTKTMKTSKKKQELIANEITNALKTIRQNGTSKVMPSLSNLTDSELESIANYLTGWLDGALSKSKK